MKSKKVFPIGVGILLLLLLFCYIRYSDKVLLDIILAHWIELLVTIIIGVFTPKIITLYSDKKTDYKTTKLVIYLIATAQAYYLIATFFVLPDLEHRLFDSPIGTIGKVTLFAVSSGVFTWYLYRAIQGIAHYIYMKVLIMVKKTKTTKDDQIAIWTYSIFTFALPIVLVFLWSYYGLGLPLHLASISPALLIAFGFGIRGIIHDYISGVFINFEDLVNVGDMITVSGQKGRVSEINFRYLTLKTLSGNTEYIPNGTMISSIFTNHTKEKYIGIFENFSIPLCKSEKAKAFQKDLITYINTLNPVADEEIGQEKARVVVTFVRSDHESMFYRYEFMVKVPELEKKDISSSERYFAIDEIKIEIKQNINYKIIDIIGDNNIITHH